MKVTDPEVKQKLTLEQYRVVAEKGTEPPFSGQFDDFFETGQYKCVACGQILFKSDTKYDAGCGWPSFWAAVDNKNIELESDSSLGVQRTEVMCGNCGAHLGHVFEDGPQEHGGQRYCINSLSLNFEPKEKK